MYHFSISAQRVHTGMGVGAFWRRASQPAKVLVVVLAMLGIGFLTLGFLADQMGWWTTRPFLSNLVSGATSACFGVPFALLILSSLTARQAEEQQRTNAENLYAGALAELASSVMRVTASESHDRLDTVLDLLTTTVIQRADALLGLRLEDQDGLPAVRHRILGLAESVSELEEFLEANFSYPLDMAEHWASAFSQWRFLDEYVKPRLYEHRLPWIRSDAAARFDTVLREGRNPFIPAVSLRDTTLRPLKSSLSQLAESKDDDLIEELPIQRNINIPELRRELYGLRSELPRAMRLREALAIAQRREFTIGLVPGHGLSL